jgi:hypothetical protein
MGRFERHGSAQQVPNARRVHEETVQDPEQAGFAIARVDLEARDGIVNTEGNRSSVGPALPTLKRFKAQRLSALGVVAAATAIGAIVLFVWLSHGTRKHN